MNGIRAACLVIHAVEQIFLIAPIVDGLKFGGIEEAAGVQAVGGDEISPLLVSDGEIESANYGAEAAVGAVHAAGWLAGSEARLRCNFDHQAGLVAELCGRSSRNRFD